MGPFYQLKAYGFPASLSAKKLPRCQVGDDKSKVIYMWKDEEACKFLGGKLIYQNHQECKTGKPHQWARVVKCVQGPVLSNKGFSYKHGGKAPAVDAMKKCPAMPFGNALKSLEGKTKVHVTFINRSKESVSLMWHDYKGVLRSYGNIAPGAKKGMTTYVSHPWSIKSLTKGKNYMVGNKSVWSAVPANQNKEITIE